MSASEKEMFGCTLAEVDQIMSRFLYLDEFHMLAMQMLSDSQEMLERGQAETARQFINRAKYVMSRYYAQLRDVKISGS